MSKTLEAIQEARSRVILLLEDLFYNWGRFVARKPLVVIFASLLFSGKGYKYNITYYIVFLYIYIYIY